MRSCSKKIHFKDEQDLYRQLEKIGAARISGVKPCTPDATDTDQWAIVYFWI